jgi:hypothetical protein
MTPERLAEIRRVASKVLKRRLIGWPYNEHITDLLAEVERLQALLALQEGWWPPEHTKAAVADMRERCAAKMIENAGIISEQGEKQTDLAWREVYRHKATALEKAASAIRALPLE